MDSISEQEQIRLLQAMPIFGGVSEEALRFLMGLATEVKVPQEGYFYREGDPGKGREYFDELVTAATATLVGDEVLLANVSGERTDFIRLNNSDVRQAGTIDQQSLSVDLVEGRRHTAGSIRLSGDRSVDDALTLARQTGSRSRAPKQWTSDSS